MLKNHEHFEKFIFSKMFPIMILELPTTPKHVLQLRKHFFNANFDPKCIKPYLKRYWKISREKENHDFPRFFKAISTLVLAPFGIFPVLLPLNLVSKKWFLSCKNMFWSGRNLQNHNRNKFEKIQFSILS